DPAPNVGVPHVVDHHRDLRLGQQLLELGPFLAERVSPGVPAHFATARDRPLEAVGRRHDLELLPEIEACAAYAGLVHVAQLAVAGVVVDDDDAAIIGPALQGIDQDPVV